MPIEQIREPKIKEGRSFYQNQYTKTIHEVDLSKNLFKWF